MSIFLNNILPRIKQFSASLDQKELFVDKPWAVIDEELNQQKYIFRRSGELVMSLNGQVLLGTWEYLVEAKCILLDRVSDKILLNHSFLDSAVMILRKDGPKNENLILANEDLIPDLNVVGYLKRVLNKNELEKLRINKPEELTRKDLPEVAFTDLEHYQILKDERVNYSFQTSKGLLVIETKHGVISKGDPVYLNGDWGLAPAGKYRIGFMRYVVVKVGRFSKFTFF